MTRLTLKCTCGKVRGSANVPESMRGSCLCADCQAYAHYLGRAKDILDANGGTDIMPVAPADLEITQGMEELRCMRLSPKGMIRWFAGCCKTPVGNTLASSKIPFAGMPHLILDLSKMGPVRFRYNGESGIGPLPAGTYKTAPFSIMLRTIRFLVGGWIRRAHTPSPFFDSKTGKPTSTPYLLTSAEREALRKLCGPK